MPSEKIYSFRLNDLAKASADKYSHGQAIAYSGARWVTGYKELLGRKINPQSHTKRIEDRESKIEVRLATAQGDPLSSILRRRSSSGPSWMNLKSIHSKGSNFMTTEEVIASLNTVIENQKIIKENQEIIKANQEKLDALLANQETIQANQSKILANQSEIISLLSK
jgi:hypothetical protein